MKKISAREWWQQGFVWILRLAVLITAYYKVGIENNKFVALCLLVLALSFLPELLRKLFNLRLPFGFQLTYLLFIIATFYFGEVHGFYWRIWWWDDVMHTLSGVLAAFLGFLLVYVNGFKKHPLLLAFVVLCIGMSAGVFWELVEFSYDEFFGTNSQDGSLYDTMMDLVFDSLGSLFLAVAAYIYCRFNKPKSLHRSLMYFLTTNPHISVLK